MKQTAVEWLHIELQKRFPKETFEMYNKNQLLYEDIIAQAKQMEKEQIIKAVDSNFSYDNNGYSTLGEQYYNKTFKSE